LQRDLRPLDDRLPFRDIRDQLAAQRFRGAGAMDFEAMSDRVARTVQILLRGQLSRRSSIFLG